MVPVRRVVGDPIRLEAARWDCSSTCRAQGRVLPLSDVVEPLAAALASMAQGLHLDQVAVTADGAFGQA